MANYTIEFDFRTLGDGRSASARYANNSNYRNDSLIRKESMYECVEGMMRMLTRYSVRQLPPDQRDQAYCQR